VILLLAVVAGLLAGWIRAVVHGRTFGIPSIDRAWLALLALVPQFALFYLPGTRDNVPQLWVAAALTSSLVLLLLFVWCNRRYPPFWVMGAGLLMNLAAVALNGGLMPISLRTLQRMYPGAPSDVWNVGQRVGSSKNILLPVDETRLEFLADRFMLPPWAPNIVAFSLGDVLIAAGVIWFLWRAGGPRTSEV
jgi:hypothetical protein